MCFKIFQQQIQHNIQSGGFSISRATNQFHKVNGTYVFLHSVLLVVIVAVRSGLEVSTIGEKVDLFLLVALGVMFVGMIDVELNLLPWWNKCECKPNE